MQSTLTKNERKSNIANGTAVPKKKWTRKDDRNKCAGIIEHLTILFGMISQFRFIFIAFSIHECFSSLKNKYKKGIAEMALSYTYSLGSSIFTYVYDLVVDFIINLFAITRYGLVDCSILQSSLSPY